MNSRVEQILDSAHALPGDFPQSLRELDARLTQSACQTQAPIGFADRIFTASVALLPDQKTAQPRLRFVPAPRKPLHQVAWARLAMAASVALACTLALWLIRSPQGGALYHVVANELSGEALASALDPAHGSSASHYESRLSYLLETNDLTSDDLKGDLAVLVSLF